MALVCFTEGTDYEPGLSDNTSPALWEPLSDRETNNWSCPAFHETNHTVHMLSLRQGRKKEEDAMRVICSQRDLTPSLKAMSTIAKKEIVPLFTAVLFSARTQPASEQGLLTLTGTGMYGAVGVFIQLPTVVAEAGQALVPIEPLAEYISTLHGDIILHQEQEAPEIPLSEEEASVSSPLGVPKTVLPFQIENRSLSNAGTESRHRAELKAWAHDHYPAPPVEDWLAPGGVVATLSITAFKKAIAACAPVAKEGRRKGDAFQMSGILVRIDADSVDLSSTTGTALISCHLPLNAPTSLSFTGLFAGEAFSWMLKALPKHGEVILSLAWDEHVQKPVLLICAPPMTWFCRTMDAPLPRWESVLHFPSDAEWQIRRGELSRALKFFGGSAAEEYEALSLSSERTTLWMRPFALGDTTLQGHQMLQLVSSSSDLSILVDPRQFTRLVRLLVKEDMLRLQIGFFERQEGQEWKVIRFVRLSSVQTTAMMSLSSVKEVRAQPPRAPATEQQGVAVASQQTTEPVLTSQE